jgi:hypothetical protein
MHLRNGTVRFGGSSSTAKAGGSDSIDDALAIYDAFVECQSNGRIIFRNTTYPINSAMNTSALQDVDIDIYLGMVLYWYGL